MPLNTYRALPIETLHELLEVAARDIAAAVDAKEDREVGLKAMKKQIEILLQVIDEKKKEAAAITNSNPK